MRPMNFGPREGVSAVGCLILSRNEAYVETFSICRFCLIIMPIVERRARCPIDRCMFGWLPTELQVKNILCPSRIEYSLE